jgi:hypothetical protein
LKSALLHCESTEANIQIENELCSKKINLNKLSYAALNDNIYLFFTGKPEDFTAVDEVGEIEMMEEEQENIDVLDLSEDVAEENLVLLEEGNEEFLNEENELDEMNEMEEEKSLKVVSKEDFEPVHKKRVLKEKSIESFVSLPVTKFCTVIKLKNKFNFFDRYVQTKSISMKVRLLSENIM